MPRRVSLPAADELFRSTGGAAVQSSTPAAEPQPAPSAEQSGEPGGPDAPEEGADGGARDGRAARAPRAKPERERSGREAPVPSQPQRDGQARTGGGPPAKGPGARAGAPATPRKARGAGRRPSGRERHDEKITVYVSAEELMDLEHARLVLRGEHGLAVDRGRIVREAVAVVLADLESRGDASILVRRLRGR
ncbi:hypothetical protein RM844_26655 [Streptomyces sp. DSM 44915]|uniref:Uncharacterized protein n=1 Tax=Streptomyces chisholmiae TaxID=3075540 RepID=A0ABU2JXY9_9ACTN|nr:hypothetical protein [Streptomyces sp. DSM 44915]MDT0269868.1 hypothetical protein [Streptomyces sp. DSM 44915]